MASNRIWNLMYALGNTGRIVGDAANPQDRAGALGGAATISGNGWRVWVEHKDTGKRIFESDKEVAHRKAGGTLTTMQDWRDANPEPTHGCGHMQGRGAA